MACAAIHRSFVDTVCEFEASPIFPLGETLYPASPSLQWVPWSSVPHLPGPLGPSVLCSAKTASCPSLVSSFVTRFPVPRLLSVFVRRCARALTDAWGFCSSGRPLPFRFSTWRHAALPSSRSIPLNVCPALRPRWCSDARHCAFRTAVFQLSETVDFPSNALKVILLTTMSTISGLTNTAYILATPSSAPPLARTHAGSLPTCWLSFGRMGLEVFRLSPIG